MPRRGSPYGYAYEQERARMLSTRPPCFWCHGPGADSADHVPALWAHSRPHVHGSGCCRLVPAHLRCNIKKTGGWKAAGIVARRNARMRRGA